MADQTIEDGWVVTLGYTLLDASDELLESSEPEGAPMMYLHGGNEMPEGFQKAMAGHALGDSFSFVLTPDEGWGIRSENAVAEVTADELGLEVEVGDVIEAEDEDGDLVDLAVLEVRDDGSVLLDGNHPLAGQTITWKVQVADLRRATAGEIEAGEVEAEDEEEDS